MKIFKTKTRDFVLVNTKSGKTLLKLFDREKFELTNFVVDDDSLLDVISDYEDVELVFAYFRNFNGWGSLLKITDDSDGVVYNATE